MPSGDLYELNTPAAEAYLGERKNIKLTYAEEIKLTSDYQRGLTARTMIDSFLENNTTPIPLLYTFTEKGDNALETLIDANRGLVISWAQKYMGRGVGFLDLIQEGNMAVMDAASDFKPEKSRFGTHLSWQLRGRIPRAVDEQGHIIALPVNLCERIRELNSLEEEVTQELGRFPTDDELKQRLPTNWKKGSYDAVFQWRKGIASIYQPITDDGNKELLDVLPDDEDVFDATNQDDSFLNNFSVEDVQRIINTLDSLSANQRELLLLEFGLADGIQYEKEELLERFQIESKVYDSRKRQALLGLRHRLGITTT